MTRGVTALVHGDVASSVILNPGALLLVAAAIFLLVRWRMRSLTAPRALTIRTGSVAATLAGLWAWQLFKYSTGRPL
jgi:hypothetical protein